MGYLLLLCTGAVGIFNLIKDWTKHGSSLRRYTVLVLILLGVILGCINLRSTQKTGEQERRQARIDRENASKREQENHDEIVRLKQAVDSGNKAQATNNKSFLEALDKLYTKTESEKLRSEITRYQKDILKNIAPPEPSATMLASFPTRDTEKIPIKEISKKLDGARVPVELFLFNSSRTIARKGTATIRICGGCIYATESNHLTKVDGQAVFDRSYRFESSPAGWALETLSFEVIPPVGAKEFTIGVFYDCDNCVHEAPPQTLTVHILK